MAETLRFLMVSTHFPPYHLGGDAVAVKYLSEELAANGHEVHVLHYPPAYRAVRGKTNPPELELIDDKITRHRVTSQISKVATAASLVLGTRARAMEIFDELTRRIKPDIVHWHNTKGFIGTPLQTSRAISAYTAHDYYAVCTRSNLIRPDGTPCRKPGACMMCNLLQGKPVPFWRAGKGRVLSMPRGIRVVAPSQFMADRLAEDGIPTSKVIRNFVPDSGYQDPGSVADRNLILYVGLLEQHKGPHTLLEAFLCTSAEHGFRLCFVGDGSLKTSLGRRVRDAGLSERVSLPGLISRQELRRLRGHASVQVIPSEWYENSPLTALEALAAGVPLIGSDIGGLSEILTPDSGALTFIPGDVEDLADTLRRFWVERETIDRRRTAARKSYETLFVPGAHIKAYLNEVASG